MDEGWGWLMFKGWNGNGGLVGGYVGWEMGKGEGGALESREVIIQWVKYYSSAL